MTKRSNHNALEVGDRVRVKTSNGGKGDTLYVITGKATQGFGCTIREADTDYAEQPFDTSLLILEPDAKKTAAAMNASGAFRPFKVRG
jgi:hypothetical protein